VHNVFSAKVLQTDNGDRLFLVGEAQEEVALCHRRLHELFRSTLLNPGPSGGILPFAVFVETDYIAPALSQKGCPVAFASANLNQRRKVA
jgi:hypothetical protein